MLMAIPSHVRRPVSGPRLSDIAFCAWISQAGPGECLEYHRGFLGIDVTPVISLLPETERRSLCDLAHMALRAFEAGLVHLVQVRLGPDRFAYLAIARRRSRSAEASLSRLLLPDPEAA